jgi:hypothetical protein
MPIVGFNFTKIHVERKGAIKGRLNISNDVALKDVKERNLALSGAKQKGISFVFDFNSKYGPDVGQINLAGEILYIGEAAEVDNILAEWKKGKKVPKEVMTAVLNTALTKCNIQALILSQEINLPPPIPLPKVGASKK